VIDQNETSFRKWMDVIAGAMLLVAIIRLLIGF